LVMLRRLRIGFPFEGVLAVPSVISGASCSRWTFRPAEMFRPGGRLG
jgi:hypothetical protein